MNIEIKELSEFAHFSECLVLQEKIFGLSDQDKIPPPYIGMLARKRLPIGLALGAFERQNDSERMVGFSFNTATFIPGSIYCILVGVLPEYQGHGIALELFKKLRETALKKSIRHFYCIFDVLGGAQGNFYFNKIGLAGVAYESEPFELADQNSKGMKRKVPVDVIYLQGDLESVRIHEKLTGSYRGKPFSKVLSQYPVVTGECLKDESDAIILEIPGDFQTLRKQNPHEAISWRMRTRKILDEYINNRRFWITEFYSEENENGRRNYYLLEKQEGI